MRTVLESPIRCRVALYLRVSTENQDVEGWGLEAQLDSLKKYIELHEREGYVTKPEWIFQDTISGSERHRPQLAKLLRLVEKKEIDTVVVYKIDRLSRNLKDLLELCEFFKKHGVGFVSVQENIDFRGAIGQLIFNIFGSIAEFERELIKDRTWMGKMASARMGNYTGPNIPYGYKEVKEQGKKGRHLEIIPEEKQWIEKIFTWYVQEGLGDGAISKKLNELGVKRPNKGPQGRKGALLEWTPRVVEKIVEREIYTGEYIACDIDPQGKPLPESEWTIVKVPPCISRLDWEMAKQIRENKVHKGGGGKNKYMLSGLLKDMSFQPERAFIGASRTKGGFSYRRKQFNNPQTGLRQPVFEIPAKQMDDFVWDKVANLLTDPEAFVKQYLFQNRAPKSRSKELTKEIEQLQKVIAECELQIRRIHDLYESGGISMEVFEERMDLRNKTKEEASIQLRDKEDALQVLATLELEAKELTTASGKFAHRMDSLTLREKQLLVRIFIKRVEIRKTREEEGEKVRTKVVMRFKPGSFKEALGGGRTHQGLTKDRKSLPNEKNNKNGDPGGI